MRTSLRTQIQRSIAVLTGALLIGTLVAGCGKDDKPPAEAVKPAALTKVVVGLGSSTFQGADIMVAKVMGIFEKYGLDVELQHLSGSGAIGAALNGGSIQIADGDGSAVGAAVLNGIDLVFFGATLNVFPMQMWARKGITSVEGLRGKKVGSTTPGSLTQVATAAVLKANGLKESDVKLIQLANAGSKFAALQSGAIDAALANPPGGDKAAGEGATMIFDASKIPNMSSAYSTTREYASKNPEVLANFLRATREGIVALRKDPAKANEIVRKYSKEVPGKFEDIAYNFFAPLFSMDPAITPSLLAISMDNAVAATGKKANDYASYYDDTAVKALQKEGFLEKLGK